jgi:hypothetical protein
MARADWLLGREQDFADLCGKWKTEMEDPVKVAAYGWDQTEVTAALGKIGGFLDARSAYKADDSSAKRLAKDGAKEESKAAMRDFANTSVRFNKKMDEAAKARMGVFPRDTTPTRHPTPSVRPDIVVENTRNHFEHKIRALDPANGKATKPEGVHGMRYSWQVGGEKPASAESLPKSKFSRKTDLVITHTEADKAQTAYYAVSYENSAGDAGPWSPVEEAVIG